MAIIEALQAGWDRTEARSAGKSVMASLARVRLNKLLFVADNLPNCFRLIAVLSIDETTRDLKFFSLFFWFFISQTMIDLGTSH